MGEPLAEQSELERREARVSRIESLIEEGDKRAFFDPVRLQEIAEAIHRESEEITYQRGLIYGEYFSARVLYKQSSFEQALPRYASALENFEEIGDEQGIKDGLRQLGLTYQMLCRYPESLEYFHRELIVRRNAYSPEISGVASTLGNIATMYLLLGQQDVALQHYLEAFALLEREEGGNILASILANIANLYMSLGDYGQAMEHLQKTVVLCKQISNKPSEANAWLNMGWNYLQCGEYEQALKSNDLALKLFEELGDKKRKAVVLLHIGQIYTQLRQYEKAVTFFEQSSEISHDIGDKRNCISISRAMGDIYIAMGEGTRAKDHYLQSLTIVKEIGVRQMEYELCELLAQTEEKQGNTGEALHYYREYMRVKEEVLDERRRQSISEMQVRFNVEQAEKEKEIYRLKNVELAGALEEVELLNEHLSEMDTEKNEMLGIVAHDLRSPLSGVRLVCSMLREHHQRMPSSELVSHLDEVVGVTSQMLGIVNSLLDVQAIESGTVYSEYRVVAVGEVVQPIAKRYRESGGAKAVELLEEYTGGRVLAHEEALQQVVGNLLSNAVKFSPHGGSILLRVEQKSEAMEISVADQGPGINPSDMDKLFKKFSRLQHRPTGGESSTGLGLWIVKKLVESMGGSVECESEVGKGSTFRVLLPLSAQQEVIRE